MSGRVDDALTVLREVVRTHGGFTPESHDRARDAVDVLAGELERLREDRDRYRGWVTRFWVGAEREAWDERMGPGDWALRVKTGYAAERDALAVQVEQLREALRKIADLSSQDVRFAAREGEGGMMRKIARAALEAGSTAPAVSAGNEQ